MNSVVGLGYVGRHLLARLDAPISVLTRSSEKAEMLRAEGMVAHVGDLDDPTSLESFGGGIDCLWYFAPPASVGVEDTRMANLLVRLAGDPPKRIVYISTSGVYGDCEGQWVDENSVTKPVLARALRRRNAEEQLSRFSVQHGMCLVILRVPGIYGEGRLPLARIRAGVVMVCAEEAPYTNRVHVYDLVSACLQAASLNTEGVFNVSDNEPSTMTDYFNAVADAAGLDRPECVPLTEAASVLSSGMMSYLQESRRLDNTKMREVLGVVLKYPALGDGLKAIAANGKLTYQR